MRELRKTNTPYSEQPFLEIIEKKNKEIEELKRYYEEQIQYLKDAIDNLPGSIYWKNSDGVYLGNNRFASEKMRSVNLNASVVGKTDYDLFDKAVADEFRKHDLEIMQKNCMLSKEEVTILEDGTKIVQLSTKRPLHDAKGNIIGIVGNTVDITELKKIENDLREAKEKAEESDKIKTEFLRNMEHDIRTPLTGIWSLTSRLFKKEKDSTKKTLLDAVVKCSKELIDYFNEIIDIVRIKNSAAPLIAKKFDLHKLIASIVNIELPAALDKKLPLIVEYPENIPKVFISDPNRLQRILINLISNSIKFTQKGYVKISTSVSKTLPNKEVIVHISVEDTGIGIPKEKQTYIYEKFYRSSPSSQSIYKGTGLGLNVVKQLMGEMEGEIDLKSELNKGTTFICTILMKLPISDRIFNEE